MITQKVLFNEIECEKIMNLKKINIQNWVNNDRNYESQSIDFNNNTEWIFNKLKVFFEQFTDFKIIKNKDTIHYHNFKKGNWFGLHNDIRENRLFGVGVLLNDKFNGGDFKFYDENEITIDKKIGNSYIFDVKINHEILPIISGERFSLLWFLEAQNLRGTIKNLI
jgi:hypothetical protein